MSSPIPQSLEALILHLMKLPTIGRRSAERLAFHLLKVPREQVDELALAMTEAREKLMRCKNCFNIAEESPCPICTDPDREGKTLCVVEEFMDAVALEAAGGFRGRYHILGGCLSPLKGITTADLNFDQLEKRVASEGVEELILAMNPSVDGEVTALFITNRFRPRGIRLSRIAMGLPMGGSLEHADEQTLQRALEGRTEI